MQVACLHCDAATVRDGLLHVLGAGITRIGRAGFPSHLGTALAFQAVMAIDEGSEQHTIEVRLLGPDNALIFTAEGRFEPTDRDALRPDEDVTASLAFPLDLVPLPAPGEYIFEIHVDANPAATLRFRAVELPG